MLNKYIMKNGKKLRYGYTTGSCAAAAAKAATILALTGERMDTVSIDTPKGWRLTIPIEEALITEEFSWCSVKKDGGDDPDITNGVIIVAHVQILQEPVIELYGGKGVGMITKPGLPISPGHAAINPVPRMMIEKEVKEVLPSGKGAKITISVPKGEEIAGRTFNPRLGIVGGISILGTTGIVEPMSEEAFKDSLALEISMAVQEGREKLILVPGNHGRDLAVGYYGLKAENIIKTSNFVGFMLEKCVEYGIKKVLMIGHIGKFVKLAGGIFHTHSRVADGRLEILASNLALLGAEKKLIEELFHCVTTEAALDQIEKEGFESVYGILCNKAELKCQQHVYDDLEIGVIMFGMENRILGLGENAKKILEEFRHE